jgi:hypothetical protein
VRAAIGYDCESLAKEKRLMNRSGVLRFFAICGALVSAAVFIVGALVIYAVLVDFVHLERFSRLHPTLNLNPESSLLNLSFGYICLTFLLSVIFGTTAVGLLKERTWSVRAARFVVPCFSWVLFLAAAWTFHGAKRLSSDVMLVVGPGLIEAILVSYVLPWFLAIGTLWIILLARTRKVPDAPA